MGLYDVIYKMKNTNQVEIILATLNHYQKTLTIHEQIFSFHEVYLCKQVFQYDQENISVICLRIDNEILVVDAIG